MPFGKWERRRKRRKGIEYRQFCTMLSFRWKKGLMLRTMNEQEAEETRRDGWLFCFLRKWCGIMSLLRKSSV
jgi:hypothetical protein